MSNFANPSASSASSSPAGSSSRSSSKASGKDGAQRRVTSTAQASTMYVISVAAELSGMHAQTLRTYDRMGLVSPMRTQGGGRRYSDRDISMLRKIQTLSQDEGVNLAGIKAIIELTEERDALAAERDALAEELAHLRAERNAARPSRGGELVHVPRSTSVVMWKPRRGRRG